MFAGLSLVVLSMTAAEPQGEPRDEMVDRALVYLQKTQEKDGSWPSSKDRKLAVTSLAVMAFLAADSGPDKGLYAENVAKGVRWVLEKQLDGGLIADIGGVEMYVHGISTLMLAQVLPQAKGDLAKEIEKKLDKAVALIVKAQRTDGNHAGAWRYQIKGVDGDLSVSGWQLQALRAAKAAGRDVPARSLEAAVQYILKAHDPITGGFRYFPASRLTIPCTAVGLLMLDGSTDLKQKEIAVQAETYLLLERNLPRWGKPHCLYELYYGAKAMHSRGGNGWKLYRPVFQKVLQGNQMDNGSWKGPETSGNAGPVYCTAMAVLALTVDGYQPAEKPKD